MKEDPLVSDVELGNAIGLRLWASLKIIPSMILCFSIK